MMRIGKDDFYPRSSKRKILEIEYNVNSSK